jgi:hypothetical protein
LTKEPRTYVGEQIASSTSSGGITGYPHVENCSWSPASHPLLISIQSESETLM